MCVASLGVSGSPAAAATEPQFSGVVSLDGQGPAGAGEVRVGAFTAQDVHPSTLPVEEVTTDATGRYEFRGLVDGTPYRLRFVYSGAGSFADAWWRSSVTPKAPISADFATATSLVAGATPAAVDMTLPIAGSLSGAMTSPRDSGIEPSMSVVLRRKNADGANYGYPITADVDETTGAYAVPRILPGEYEVEGYSNGYLSDWYGASANDLSVPGRLIVEPGGVYTFDPTPRRAAGMSASVYCEVCGALPPNADGMVSFERLNEETGLWEGKAYAWLMQPSGTTAMAASSGALYPGTYRVAASFPYDPRAFAISEPVVLDEGDIVEQEIHVRGPEIDRLAGADRYATAAAVSGAFEPGVPVAFVASGEGFADALSAGPAAAELGGPVLLVTGSSVPDSTRSELSRLKPKRIVIVGGPAVITRAVATTLAGFAPELQRIGGTDRFDTSRKVAAFAFGAGASTAYVASGLTFADAVSAGAAAAHRNAPVLLVNGANGDIDGETAAALVELGTNEVHIVGGTAVVHAGIETALAKLPGMTVERHAGDDRYRTSQLVNADAWDESPIVFLASGLTFPDALAGAAYAGSLDAPLFMIPGWCVPSDVAFDLKTLSVRRIVLLGGPAVINAAVEELQPC